MTFVLDPILDRDSLLIGDLDGFTCRLINDSRFIWLILVPTFPDISEIYQLDAPTQYQLNDISTTLGRELMKMFNGNKLNVATIGNIVSQLHIHHVVRMKDDAAWPGPVWGSGTAIPYKKQRGADLVSQLRTNLSLMQDN